MRARFIRREGACAESATTEHPCLKATVQENGFAASANNRHRATLALAQRAKATLKITAELGSVLRIADFKGLKMSGVWRGVLSYRLLPRF